MPNMRTWPNGKKVAVSVNVMFETWSEGHAPTYSVQTTHLKGGTVDHAGKAWSTYGGRVGVWRLINMLDGCGFPAPSSPMHAAPKNIRTPCARSSNQDTISAPTRIRRISSSPTCRLPNRR